MANHYHHPQHGIFQSVLSPLHKGHPYAVYAFNHEPAAYQGVRVEVSALGYGRVAVSVRTGRSATLRILDGLTKDNALGIEMLAKCLLSYWTAKEASNG